MDKNCPVTVDATCPACVGLDFEVRALTDERVATLKCLACNRNFLLLDSEDYWFDVIQNGYPRRRKCSCGSTSFSLHCDYDYRVNGDVRAILVRTICSSCARANRLLETDINYSGTESLVEQPLRYCENPKILYALQKLSLYAKRDDIARIINFLGASCGCSFVGWIRKDDAWVKQALTREQAEETVCPVAGSRKPPAYLRIYAFHSSFEMPDAGVTTVKDEDLFWKQHEIIRVSSPTHIGIGGKLALLFQIDFANEFISGPKIVPKSDDFIEMTSSLLRWLKAEFVTWRGPRCFDNAAENIRIFGNRFRNDK